MDQWVQRTRGLVGTEDQRNSGYRGSVNSGHRGPEEQRAQRISSTVEKWEQRIREQGA